MFWTTGVYNMGLGAGQVKNRPESGLQAPPLSLRFAAMSTARIHRYIAREVAIPALLALAVFTSVLLMGRILKLMELVVNKGVPALEIIQLFACLLPTFLVLTLPLAFLLGVMLGFGRLSADSEIVAIKASGISLYRMFKPVLILAGITSLLTALMTMFAGPAGNRAFREQIFEIAAKRANVGIQPQVFNDEFDDLVLYVNQTDERQGRFEGVMISDQRTGSTPSIIFAQQGRIFSDQRALTLTLRLENGAIHRSAPGKEAYQIVKFSTYDLNLNMGQQLDQVEKRPLKPAEISFVELGKTLFASPSSAHGDPKLAIEFHTRLIFPLAPLIFALIGIPLGIQSQRSGRGGNFSLALAIFLGYYLTLSLVETLIVESGFPPGITLWLPNLLFFAGGLLLFHQAAKEKRLRIPGRIWTLWRKDKRRP